MAIENGQMSLWNRKTWARMAQPKAKIVNPPHLISPPPTPSLTSQTPLFRSLDSNFGEKVKCSISCLSSSPKISLVDQSHLMIITLAFDIHHFDHNPDQDQEQLTLFWGCDISRKSVNHNLSSKSEPHCTSEHIEDQSRVRAVGSSARIPSHSCLSICPTWWGRSWSCEPCTCPSYFWFWEDELLSKELMMWTFHLPFALPDLPRRFGLVWFKSTVLVCQNFHICLLRSWRLIWRLP